MGGDLHSTPKQTLFLAFEFENRVQVLMLKNEWEQGWTNESKRLSNHILSVFILKGNSERLIS